MTWLKRSTPLKRRTPLNRGDAPLRREPTKRYPEEKRFSPESVKRARQRREYAGVRRAFLAAHPLCQVAIAFFGLDEELVLDALREICAEGAPDHGYLYLGRRIPRATTIHHRNKRNGARLVDDRFFISASPAYHELIEANKSWARDHGFLLPINADVNGSTPAGPGETTPELMRRRAAGGPIPIPLPSR